MTRDTVDRATKRGTGELEGVEYQEVRYEGYAMGCTAVLVECTTDNRNRTVSEVRHVFAKYGGHLGTDGSVAYLFTKTGVFAFGPGTDEEEAFLISLTNVLDTREAIRQSIVSILPMKPLCKQECVGICPHCGVNSNEVQCHCDVTRTDSRWEQLLELLPSTEKGS